MKIPSAPNKPAILLIILTSYVLIVLDTSIILTGLPKMGTAHLGGVSLMVHSISAALEWASVTMGVALVLICGLIVWPAAKRDRARLPV